MLCSDLKACYQNVFISRCPLESNAVKIQSDAWGERNKKAPLVMFQHCVLNVFIKDAQGGTMHTSTIKQMGF